jgi:Bacterial regulatory helix-turn-helix protein, lysR family
MELHQVRYFLALCNEKNFTRAAKHCGVSQPSLSNAIRKLEAELGGPLFHRNRADCPPSELGRAVWPHLARLDQCATDARRQAAEFLAAPAAAPTVFEQVLTRLQGGLGPIWASQNNWRKGIEMTKPMYIAGACALLVAASLVWSQSAPVSSRAHTVSASFVPQQSHAVTPQAPAFSPAEMMRNHSGPLPAESWHAF